MIQRLVFIILTPFFLLGLLLFWVSHLIKTAGLWLMSIAVHCRGNKEYAAEIWNDTY